MFHTLVTMCIVTLVASERQWRQQQMDTSRRTRSSYAPVHGGYVYNHVDTSPGVYSSLGSVPMESYSLKESEKYSDSLESGENPQTYQYIKPISITKTATEPGVPFTGPQIPKYSPDYEIAKAEAKYNSKFLPSKMKTDAMYERLKSVMHYHPPDTNQMVSVYDSSNEYHVDDDDIRTSSRSLYDSWPYFYHSPYEYEHLKIDADIEKAKDKRYAVDNAKEVIPVQENFEEDNYNYPYSPLTTPELNTDNPMIGDKAFFSFVLNDYFDKSDEEDSLLFKGLNWGKEFDSEQPFTDMDDYAKRKRRLGSNYYIPTINDGTIDSLVTNKYNLNEMQGESVTDKGYNNKHELDNFENKDHQKYNSQMRNEQTISNNKGFKDFVNGFANKFGSENHNKDSKYILKRNQDKGENKKGFRRVYHKDEYQQEDEFYDNNNSSVKAEEKGNSNAQIAGLEAILNAHTAAASGEETNAYNTLGNTEKKTDVNNHRAHDASNGLDNMFSKYRDMAKNTAQSNSVDYTDHYSII